MSKPPTADVDATNILSCLLTIDGLEPSDVVVCVRHLAAPPHARQIPGNTVTDPINTRKLLTGASRVDIDGETHHMDIYQLIGVGGSLGHGSIVLDPGRLPARKRESERETLHQQNGDTTRSDDPSPIAR